MTIKTIAATTVIVAASASTAFAGGLDRSTYSSSILFEKGTYAELAYGLTTPKVSSTGFGAGDGDVAESFNTVKLGFKIDLNDKISFAMTFNNQPVGADINYANTPIGPFVANAAGYVDASATTLIGKYKITDAFSIYGGAKYQSISATANILAAGSFGAVFQSEDKFGYIAGVAFEKPEIAMRVALSYESKIEYNLNTLNAGGVSVGTTTSATPEAWTLEFQSGVAPKTLVFGKIRRAMWSDANIFVPLFAPGTTGALTTFTDVTSYELGVGRRFSDKVTGAITFSYEKKDGTVSSLFAPTDGLFGISVGTSVSIGKGAKISGGISYSKRGDTTTAIGPFTDNTVTTVGMKLSKNF